MPRVVHFEIHASDPARMVKFYTEVFDWKFMHRPEMQYWLVMTGDEKEPGINGGLMQRRGPKPDKDQPVSAHVCTVDVPSVEEYWKRALAAGALPALPKKTIPGVGYAAYLKDPDGNIFGIYQADKAAH